MKASGSSMGVRSAQLLALLLVVASVTAGCAARRSRAQDLLSVPQADTFHDKIQNLRKLAATAQDAAAHKLIESLDEIDDLELTQLRIPKRALASSGHRQLHAGYGGEARHLLQGPYGGQHRSLAAYP